MKLASTLNLGSLIIFLAFFCSTINASSLRLQDTIITQGVITVDTIFWKNNVDILEDVVLQLNSSSVWIVDSSANVAIVGAIRAASDSQLKITSFDGVSLDGRTIFKLFGNGRALTLQKFSVEGLRYISPDSVSIDTFSNVNLFGFSSLAFDSLFIERNGFSVDEDFRRFGGYGAIKVYNAKIVRIGYVYSVDNRAMFRASSLGLFWCDDLLISEGFFARNISADTIATSVGSGGGGGLYTAFLNTAVIDRCVFINNTAAFAACVLASDTISVTNSIFINNTDGLFTGFGYQPAENMHEVVNCTFYQNEGFDYAMTEQVDIYNSLFVSRTSINGMHKNSLYLGNSPSPRFHNSYRTFECSRCDDINDSGVELFSNMFPLLDSTMQIDETTINQLTPSSASILVDAGQSSVVTTAFDVLGAGRIQGAAIDIGAFESPFTVSVVEYDPKYDFNLYPNPASTYIEISSSYEISFVDIYDSTGRLISNYVTDKVRNVRLPLPSGVTTGLYNVQVRLASGEAYSKSLVIQ